jgi:hypothetical protein
LERHSFLDKRARGWIRRYNASMQYGNRWSEAMNDANVGGLRRVKPKFGWRLRAASILRRIVNAMKWGDL